jgi:hypothetical protein
MEVSRVLLPQGDAATEQPELDRVAANGRARVFHLRALDEAEHHEPLDLRVHGIDGLDDGLLAAL